MNSPTPPRPQKIIHVDMDCFFAAVEMREQPAWRNIPLAVGGAPDRRGVIATCNYVARQYGVRSAMSSFQALKRCPDLKIVPGNMALYRQVAGQIRQIFARYSDRIEPLSLDEAYLDVSDSLQLHNSATLIAQAIRRDIAQELALTASAGVACNKFLAKLASEQNKPDGLCVIRPEQSAAFAAALPLERYPGVGPATLARLHKLNLHSGADVLAAPPLLLAQQLGRFGLQLQQLAQGLDPRQVQTEHDRRSVSVEHTYDQDLHQLADAQQRLESLLEQLEVRLLRLNQKKAILAQFVKLKFSDFTQTSVSSRSRKLSRALVKNLLNQGWERRAGKGVRLLGVGVELAPGEPARQLSFRFETPAGMPV